MVNPRLIIEHHIKAIRVIRSCVNSDQLEGAERFCLNMLRFHAHQFHKAPLYQKAEYLKQIEESQEKLQLCMRSQRRKLRY